MKFGTKEVQNFIWGDKSKLVLGVWYGNKKLWPNIQPPESIMLDQFTLLTGQIFVPSTIENLEIRKGA